MIGNVFAGLWKLALKNYMLGFEKNHRLFWESTSSVGSAEIPRRCSADPDDEKTPRRGKEGEQGQPKLERGQPESPCAPSKHTEGDVAPLF